MIGRAGSFVLALSLVVAGCSPGSDDSGGGDLQDGNRGRGDASETDGAAGGGGGSLDDVAQPEGQAESAVRPGTSTGESASLNDASAKNSLNEYASAKFEKRALGESGSVDEESFLIWEMDHDGQSRGLVARSETVSGSPGSPEISEQQIVGDAVRELWYELGSSRCNWSEPVPLVGVVGADLKGQSVCDIGDPENPFQIVVDWTVQTRIGGDVSFRGSEFKTLDVERSLHIRQRIDGGTGVEQRQQWSDTWLSTAAVPYTRELEYNGSFLTAEGRVENNGGESWRLIDLV